MISLANKKFNHVSRRTMVICKELLLKTPAAASSGGKVNAVNCPFADLDGSPWYQPFAGNMPIDLYRSGNATSAYRKEGHILRFDRPGPLNNDIHEWYTDGDEKHVLLRYGGLTKFAGSSSFDSPVHIAAKSNLWKLSKGAVLPDGLICVRAPTQVNPAYDAKRIQHSIKTNIMKVCGVDCHAPPQKGSDGHWIITTSEVMPMHKYETLMRSLDWSFDGVGGGLVLEPMEEIAAYSEGLVMGALYDYVERGKLLVHEEPELTPLLVEAQRFRQHLWSLDLKRHHRIDHVDHDVFKVSLPYAVRCMLHEVLGWWMEECAQEDYNGDHDQDPSELHAIVKMGFLYV